MDSTPHPPRPPPLKVNPLARWYKPWWYTHVEGVLRGGEEVEEYVPLRHYILRHNRAIFWTLPDMIPAVRARPGR